MTRGWFDTFLDVAAGDILGAAAGLAASKTIIAYAGITTGGTGAAVVGAVCGSICGASASNQAYKRRKNSVMASPMPTVDSLVFLSIADKTYKSNLSISPENKLNSTDVRHVYNVAYDKINMPQKFEYIKRIGEDHNGLINTSLLIAKENISVSEIPLTEFKGIIPIVELPNYNLNQIIFENPCFINKYAKINQSIENCLDNDELNIDKFFNEVPLISKRVEQALKDYITLFKVYPKDIDEVAEITNGYIEIIEKNNEFTDDEKEIIYAAITVALYSPQIWNDFE